MRRWIVVGVAACIGIAVAMLLGWWLTPSHGPTVRPRPEVASTSVQSSGDAQGASDLAAEPSIPSPEPNGTSEAEADRTPGPNLPAAPAIAAKEASRRVAIPPIQRVAVPSLSQLRACVARNEYLLSRIRMAYTIQHLRSYGGSNDVGLQVRKGVAWDSFEKVEYSQDGERYRLSCNEFSPQGVWTGGRVMLSEGRGKVPLRDRVVVASLVASDQGQWIPRKWVRADREGQFVIRNLATRLPRRRVSPGEGPTDVCTWEISCGWPPGLVSETLSFKEGQEFQKVDLVIQQGG